MNDILGINPKLYGEFPPTLKHKVLSRVYNYYFTMHLDDYGTQYIDDDTIHIKMAIEMDADRRWYESNEEFEICQIIKDTIDNIERIPKY